MKIEFSSNDNVDGCDSIEAVKNGEEFIVENVEWA